MNRRSFFTKLGLAAASMAILPAATTYARHWVKPEGAVMVTPVADLTTGMNFIPNPAWETAPYQIFWVSHKNAIGQATLKVGEAFPSGFEVIGESERISKAKNGLYYPVPKYLTA